MEEISKKKRGLALVSPERRKEIASAGGKSVPRAKRAFTQNPQLAAAAGRIGKKPSSRAHQETKQPFAPEAPENANDLLVLRLKVSRADFVVVQRKCEFDLERGLQEAWFALKACDVRPPIRWTMEVRDGSGAVLMVLKNKY